MRILHIPGARLLFFRSRFKFPTSEGSSTRVRFFALGATTEVEVLTTEVEVSTTDPWTADDAAFVDVPSWDGCFSGVLNSFVGVLG